jgi:hypothetical protein
VSVDWWDVRLSHFLFERIVHGDRNGLWALCETEDSFGSVCDVTVCFSLRDLLLWSRIERIIQLHYTMKALIVVLARKQYNRKKQNSKQHNTKNYSEVQNNVLHVDP